MIAEQAPIPNCIFYGQNEHTFIIHSPDKRICERALLEIPRASSQQIIRMCSPFDSMYCDAHVAELLQQHGLIDCETFIATAGHFVLDPTKSKVKKLWICDGPGSVTLAVPSDIEIVYGQLS